MKIFSGPPKKLSYFVMLISLISLHSFGQKTADQKNIELYSLPASPLIEKDPYGQYLNFDLVVINNGPHILAVSTLQVSVFDSSGKLVLRKFLSKNGQAPSINLLEKTVIHQGETVSIFNPLFYYKPEMDLYQLKYEIFFYFQDSDGQKTLNGGRLPFDNDAVCTTLVYPHVYIGKTSFNLPLKGKLLIWDGHDFFSHHRRFPVGTPERTAKGISANSNRYAYDFIPIDSEGNMYKNNPFIRENWYAFGKPIYAPGAGLVIAAVNNIPDNVFNGKEVKGPENANNIDPLGMGNHVVIDHGNGEYSVLLHMKKGSVQVKTGDKVVQGRLIGNIGFSGDAICPHLHYTVMSGPKELVSEGVPSYFNNYRLLPDNKTKVMKHGHVDSGDIIESLIK